jgi:hypothetical protein
VVTEKFHEPIEPLVFERLREDTIEKYNGFLVPSKELFVFLSHDNLEALYQSYPDGQETTQNDREAIMVAAHWIGTMLPSCYYPQSKLCALEMLLKIALESSFDSRL